MSCTGQAKHFPLSLATLQNSAPATLAHCLLPSLCLWIRDFSDYPLHIALPHHILTGPCYCMSSLTCCNFSHSVYPLILCICFTYCHFPSISPLTSWGQMWCLVPCSVKWLQPHDRASSFSLHPATPPHPHPNLVSFFLNWLDYTKDPMQEAGKQDSGQVWVIDKNSFPSPNHKEE